MLKRSSLAAVSAACLLAATAAANAQSAWQRYDRSSPVVQTGERVGNAIVTEGPLVDGIVIPRSANVYPLDRPIQQVNAGYGIDRSAYRRYFDRPHSSILSHRDRYVREVPPSVNTTTSSVVLSNGTIVTSERTNYGGPTPPNTYGIEGLLPTPPSDIRINRGGYGYW